MTVAAVALAACGGGDDATSADQVAPSATATAESAPDPSEGPTTTEATESPEPTVEDPTPAPDGDPLPVVSWPAVPEPTDPTSSVFTSTFDRARLHTFMAAPILTKGTSHVIETENKLIVVDGHSARPTAEDFRAFVDGLGKPVERVILSHGHPDHYFGLELAWADHDIWADATTFERIAERSQGDTERLGAFFSEGNIPTTVDGPDIVLDEGTFTVDDIEFDVEVFTDIEAPSQVVLTLPQLKVLVAQDIVYSDGHLFMAGGNFDGWITTLEKFTAELDSDWVVLAGHGPPTDASIFEFQIEYLRAARAANLDAETGAEFIEAMSASYPDLADALILQFGTNQLYSEGPFADDS